MTKEEKYQAALNDPDSPDSVPATLAPTEDQMLAFAYLRLKDQQKVLQEMRVFREFDRLAIGRGIALERGYTLSISDAEREEALRELRRWQEWKQRIEAAAAR